MWGGFLYVFVRFNYLSIKNLEDKFLLFKKSFIEFVM